MLILKLTFASLALYMMKQ